MEDAAFLRELCGIVKQNKESFDAVIAEKASYPYLYHLSRIRENLVDWLPLLPGMHVLELNPGCGALTGKLLQKTGRVTCVAEDEPHAAVLRARFGGSRESKGSDGGAAKRQRADSGARLQVLLPQQWDDSGAADFDVILIAGEFCRYKERLSALRKRLLPGGMLVAADANRLGLKYWAGCAEEYDGGYFTGLEGSADGLSRSEYEALLGQAGFADVRFYYPYPDYKFPHTVYSDRRLPQRGELADNRRNFDRDRLALFDEQKVYDSLLAEGLFQKLSNSFLILAGETPRDGGRVCYEKYGNERALPFRIRTEIAEDEAGGLVVAKYASDPEAEGHIRNMEWAAGALAAAYADSPIAVCPCRVEDDGRGVRAVFPFVGGRCLKELLQEAAEAGDRGRVELLLSEYANRLRRYGGEIPFAVTPEFVRLFGEQAPDEGLPCARACNIDFIFSNIFAEETREGAAEARWTAIDYEWTFAFPVPKEFIVYRGLYFAYYEVLIHWGFGLEEVLLAADISGGAAECYQRMEEHFQEYLSGGVLPVRNMQRLMGTRIIPVQQAAAEYDGSARLWSAPGAAPSSAPSSAPSARERARLPVKKILYHIDRQERQDGGMLCAGWAVAKTWDGKAFAAEIRVTDASGADIPFEVTRRERADVAEALRIRGAEHPVWGFDCTWLWPRAGEHTKDWKIIFSSGKKEEIYTCTIRDNEYRM